MDNDKKFWMDIGVKLGQSLECSQNVEQKLTKFIENEHAHLVDKLDSVDKKVNKIATKTAWVVGAISTLTVGIHILIRVL